MTANTTLRPPPPAASARVAALPNPPKPLDAMHQSPHIFKAYAILENHLKHRPDMLVGARGYLCYDTRDHSPWAQMDCVVAFGVDPDAIFARNGYVISEVGKPPDFVLEVASESTGRRTTPPSAPSMRSTAWPNTGASTVPGANTTTGR